jgi:hypothetical protein
MKPVRPPTRPPTNRRNRRYSVELSRSPRLRAGCTHVASGGVYKQQKRLLLGRIPGLERRSGAGPLQSPFFAGPLTDRSRRRAETAHAR